MDSRYSDMPAQETNNLKQRMRADLIVAMRAHHQRRRIRRRSLATVILMISAVTLAFLALGRNNVTPPVVRSSEGDSPRTTFPQPSSEITEPRHSIITIVRTDPNILKRYVLRPSSKVKTISDETLLASLASLGRPTGLIRYDGRVRLTADVTDDLKKITHPE